MKEKKSSQIAREMGVEILAAKSDGKQKIKIGIFSRPEMGKKKGCSGFIKSFPVDL